MRQYLQLLKDIQEKGTSKPPAREGMPGSQSLFGGQFRHNLSEGFPLLTTKKMFWKGVVVELLWFLRGDTNIKYLVDNGVNIWNEDAYQYYVKTYGQTNTLLPYETFIEFIKRGGFHLDFHIHQDSNYKLGDCGHQYGKVWRSFGECTCSDGVDQIKRLIKGLKETPESRRHIVTAIDPAHDKDLALYWCHALFQFNCRPLSRVERILQFNMITGGKVRINGLIGDFDKQIDRQVEEANIPKYYLDCQLYQRSADAVLGVPFNIASYALLIHIVAKICNMVPGDFVHTFGDVHIYDNHKEAVAEQLTREPLPLPKLIDCYDHYIWKDWSFENQINVLEPGGFELRDYQSHPPIKAKLSTGLK